MSTYQELLDQKAALDQQIAMARKAQAKQALETVHELIAEFGFTAQQVFPWKPVVKSVAAKYRDPLTGASWSGRGRAPKWIEGRIGQSFWFDSLVAANAWQWSPISSTVAGNVAASG